MADDNATEVVETTEETEVDNETNVDLEDFGDESFDTDDDADDSDDAESEEVEETDDDDDGESTEEDDPEESEASETKEPETTELTAEEQRKEHNRQMAEARLKAKAERDAQLAKDQAEYVAAADTDLERTVKQLEVNAYNTAIEANSSKLTTGYEKATQDFEILRDPNPAIQAEVDAAIDAFQAQHVVLDSMGNPLSVKGDLYAYLKIKADSIAKLTGIGAKRQQTSKAQEKSKTLTPPNRAPKKAKVDPDIAAFDEEASR
jgi:hypothetical protein